MRVIMLSTDRKIFEPGSAVASRMIEYGKVLGDLQIIVFAGRKESKILSENVTVYSTNSWSRLIYIPDAIDLIIRLNRISKIDWISAQDPFETGLSAWVANIFIKTKLQLQVHTDVFSPFFVRNSFLNQARVVLAKFLLSRADRIRVVSQKILNSLVEKLPNVSHEKIIVLPVLVETEETENKQVTLDLKKKYPQFEKIVLMASRFEPEKDFGTAIRAFKQVVSKKPQTGLLIVGEGSERKKIEDLVKNLGLTKNVVIEPWVRDLFSYFKTADVYLLTSLFEGYGRTLVEASLAGTPFVSTDVGCAQELADLNLPGSVVAVGDREAIGGALISLLERKLSLEEVKKPDSLHFLSKEKFLELYRQSFV